MTEIQKLQPLPPEICQRVTKLCKDGRIFEFYEIRRGRKTTFTAWTDLTVADCEQYTKMARTSISRFIMRGGSLRTAQTAAVYIYRAKCLRYRYHELLGKPHTEEESPFPFFSREEAEAFERARRAED